MWLIGTQIKQTLFFSVCVFQMQLCFCLSWEILHCQCWKVLGKPEYLGACPGPRPFVQLELPAKMWKHHQWNRILHICTLQKWNNQDTSKWMFPLQRCPKIYRQVFSNKSNSVVLMRLMRSFDVFRMCLMIGTANCFLIWQSKIPSPE